MTLARNAQAHHFTRKERKKKDIDAGKCDSLQGYTCKGDRLDSVSFTSNPTLQERLSCPAVGVDN